MAITTSPPLLSLDRLLSNPNLVEIIQQTRNVLTAAGYRALIDQGDAATREARHNLYSEARATRAVVKHIRHPEHPEWVRYGLLTAVVAWTVGEAQTCPHSPDPRHPQPVTAAAWKPGLVVCVRCPHLLELPRDSAENWTCDGCRTVVNPGEGGRIKALTLSYGAFTYRIGICTGCLYKPLPGGRRAAR